MRTDRAAGRAPRTSVLLAIVATGLFAGLSTQPAAAQASLTDERFDGFASQNTTLTSFSCNPDGNSGFSYSSTGLAAGPYAGTYTETGTVEVGSQTEIPGSPGAFRGELLRLDAEFTIDSTLGQVSGRKRLIPAPFDPLDNAGACGMNSDFATPFDFGLAVTSSLCYRATLPDGGVDEGRSEILLAAVDEPPVKDTGLRESFVSDASVDCPVDTTPPVLQLPGATTVDATTPAGAIVSYTASASDDQDPSPAVSCTPPSGASFPIGSTTVACTATDVAGNRASGSFVVTVRGAPAQIVALVDKTLAYLDAPTLEATLKAQLEGAAAALIQNTKPAACKAMTLYIAAVRLAPASVLTAAEKADLVADATRIKAVIGCS